MLLQKFKIWISHQSRTRKQVIMLLSDAILAIFALWLSFAMRYSEFYLPDEGIFLLILSTPLLSIPVFAYFGLYLAIVRYISFDALWSVLKAVSLYTLILVLVINLTGVKVVPRSVILINWMVCLLLIGGSRVIARWWFWELVASFGKLALENKQIVIIYGAGEAGIQLALSLLNGKKYLPIAFIDDDESLQGKVIHGITVNDISKLETLKEKYSPDMVLLAMPSISNSRRKAIIESLAPYALMVQTVPPVGDIISGKFRLDEIRAIEIDDLLGRDAVKPDHSLIARCIPSRNVLVTGAGGSIGSELCRQIIPHKPARLVLFDISEFNLFNIERDIRDNYPDIDVEIIAILGSVQDHRRIEQILSMYAIEVVYHAAAYKHVPIVEHNPVEGVTNNIFGTRNLARAAINHGVDYFVLISTDKAVRPTNVMGATKRIAEMILQSIAMQKHATHFCMVRFGNVLDSSGSVVPLFREQIAKGGPVKVTHKDIIRYFMTIPEASQLVIQAGAMANQGEIFILDMGEPVRIFDLATKMIHLAGYEVQTDSNPDGDIRIEFTGLRPGEKLYEELLIDNNVSGTTHPRIMRALEDVPDSELLEKTMLEIETAVENNDIDSIFRILEKTVSGYKRADITTMNDKRSVNRNIQDNTLH